MQRYTVRNKLSGTPLIQTGLKIGKPGDRYEREADEMADRVMAMTSAEQLQMQPLEEEEEELMPKLRMQPEEEEEELIQPRLQRQTEEEEEEMVQPKIKSGGEEEEELMQPQVQRQEEEEEEMVQPMLQREKKEEEEPVQMMGMLSKDQNALQKGKEEEPLISIGRQLLGKQPAALAKMSATVQPKSKRPEASVDKAFDQRLNSSMNSGGRNLPDDVQNDMEQRFGASFGHIRIHDDNRSAELNEEINARAFTYGRHIFFNADQYSPGSNHGKRLLAHELTHTLQQGADPVQRTIGDGHDLPAASRFHGNVALEATFDNERTVQNGHSGAHVTLIQQVLTKLGYDLPIHGVDGSFGTETERAVRAFQQDVGLGVDGVVGFNTLDRLDKRDRGLEVAPPARPVTANRPFNTNNAIVQPGAAPSNALGACAWGLTFPENVQVKIDVFRNGAVWQPVLSEVVGNYSLQHRLLPPAQTEVTGPGGNTTAANYCAQITELNALGFCPGTWYMDAAVLEHERVHATRFRPALIHPTVVGTLETDIEAIQIPVILAGNAAMAELLVRADPRFVLALTNAQRNWLARILVLVAGDHAAGGPAATAEHGVVDPMVARICAHARANGWPACPPLCP